MALAPPPAATSSAAPPSAAPPLSIGLAKRPEAAGFFVDHIGAAADPRSKQPATTPAGQVTVIDGFGFDDATKTPAKGVDVVIDGKAYGSTYGSARPDVARYFKAPALVKVGFKAALPAESLTVGTHTLVVRIVAADGKGYFISPNIVFSVN